MVGDGGQLLAVSDLGGNVLHHRRGGFLAASTAALRAKRFVLKAISPIVLTIFIRDRLDRIPSRAKDSIQNQDIALPGFATSVGPSQGFLSVLNGS
jgi:hypothetical protein